MLGADIPAFLRKEASEALEGQADVACDVLTLRKQGADNPLKVNEMGHNVLSVVNPGEGAP